VIYKVIGRERDRLLHLVERQDEPGRWIVESPKLTPTHSTLLRLESEATSLVSAELVLMHGLVQTAEYVRALMQAGDVPPELVERRVDARKERQQLILDKNRPPKFDIIVDETALRRVGRAAKVRAAQFLGTSRATLYRKIHEYGIVLPDR
jgi:hypothetical protein